MKRKCLFTMAVLFALFTLWADDLPPLISHFPLLETPMYESPQYVEASITDDTTYNSPITQVRLHYSTNGTVFYYLDMTPAANNKYYGQIPAYPIDTRIMYYIAAKDSYNNTAQTDTHEFYFRSSAWRRYAPPTGIYNRYPSTFYMPFNMFDNPAYNSGYSLKIDAVEGRLRLASTAQVYIYKCTSSTPSLANMTQVAGPISIAMAQTTTTITDISAYNVEIDTPYFCVGYQIPYEIHYSYNQNQFWGQSYAVVNGTSLRNFSSYGTWTIAAKVSIGNSLNSPLSEGFEGDIFPPLNWQRINSGDANTWNLSYESPHEGLASATIEAISSSSPAHDDWLISPRLRPSASDYTFSFWAKKGDASATEKLNVKLSTGSAQSSAFTVSLAANINPPATYQLYSYNLSAYIGRDIYLAFQCSSSPGLRLYIDDVSGPPLSPVFTVPSAPSGLLPANLSTNIDPSQNLTWVLNGSGISGVKLYLDTVNPPVNCYDLGAANSYLPPLPFTKGIDYYWKVVAYNSYGESSSAVQSFRTTYPNEPGLVTVGEGNSYNAYFQAPCPYGNWNRNQRVQYLYTKDEINEAGGGMGIINSLAFNIYYLSTVQPRYFRVKIGHTTKSQLTSAFEGGLTTVYEASGTYTPITGWNTHSFNQQFVWDGESNLIVETFYGSLSVQHSINPYVYYTESPNRALYFDSETANAANQSTGTLSSWRANIRFSMQAYVPVQIPNPAILVAPADNATGLTPSVNLSWRNGGKNPSGFYLYLGTDNPPTNIMNAVDLGYITSFQTPLLDYGTDYYWSVVPYNVVGNAQGNAVWSFSTCPDPALPLPYFQNFNSASSLAGIGWSGNMSFRDASGPDGSKVLTYILGWHTKNFSATTPQLYPMQPNAMLSFDYRMVSGSYYPSNAVALDNETYVRILISTDTGLNFTPIYTINSGNHIPATYYRKMLIPLSDYSSGRVMLRFEGYTYSGTIVVDIDNVSIMVNPALAPECVNLVSPPDNTQNLPLSGFYLAWNPALSGGMPATYDLYLGKDPLTILETGVCFAGLTSNYFHLQSSSELQLRSGEQWYWTVKAINSEGFATTESAYNFRIEPATALPYSEDFSGISAGLPPRWTSTSENWLIVGTNNAGGTAPELRLFNVDYSSGANRVITPPLYGDNAGGYQLSWRNWLHADEWGFGASYRLEISENKQSWSTLWSLDNPSGVIGPEVISLQLPSSYIGKTFYLSWNYSGNIYDTYGWSIDDITIQRLYHIPEDLAVSFGSGESAVTITIEGGAANHLPADSIPPVNNGIYLPLNSFVLELFGGPWTISLATAVPWLAYYLEGEWHALENISGSGFVLDILAAKGDLELPITLGDQDPTLPVTLSSFNAVLCPGMQVQISWTVESETNHAGYNVLRNESGVLGAAIRINREPIHEGIVNGSQVSYLYTDAELISNANYYYWLESLSYNGEQQFYGPISVYVSAGDSEEPLPAVPLETKLLAAFPNPFNPSTNIRYSLAEAGDVSIQIFNLKGQLLKSYHNFHESPGNYQVFWDGKDASGTAASSGTYIYRMINGTHRFSKKMILMK